MSKQSTNDLIDTISRVIRGFAVDRYGDVELACPTPDTSAPWIEDLARQIARAVR